MSATKYYFEETKYLVYPITPNKEYTVSLNLDDADQLLVQKLNEDDDAKDTAESLIDLFSDFLM